MNCFGECHSEIDNGIEIKFSCAGKNYNPLAENLSEEFDEENLISKILKGLAKNFSHKYKDSVNKIIFKLA